MSGLWDTDEAARRMGLRRKTAIRRLHALHDAHGGLLYRAEGGPNTKLHVDAERLMQLDPGTKRRAADQGGRIEDLERRVVTLEEFRRKALNWFQGTK